MSDANDLITTAWLDTLSRRQQVPTGAVWVLGAGDTGRACYVKQVNPPDSTLLELHYGGETLRRVAHQSEVFAFCEILGVTAEVTEETA